MRAAAGLDLESGTGHLVLDSYKDIRLVSRQGKVKKLTQVKKF
jgi:hypothetical protein